MILLMEITVINATNVVDFSSNKLVQKLQKFRTNIFHLEKEKKE